MHNVKLQFNISQPCKHLSLSHRVVSSSGGSAVCVCGHHVPSALRHCSAVLLRCSVKPAFSLFGMFVESKHSLHVFKHVIKNTCSKPTLEVSLVSAVGLLVGPGLLFKVSPVTGMSVLAVDVKVLKHVIEVEAERLAGVRSLTVSRLSSEVCGFTKLVVLSSLGHV